MQTLTMALFRWNAGWLGLPTIKVVDSSKAVFTSCVPFRGTLTSCMHELWKNVRPLYCNSYLRLHGQAHVHEYPCKPQQAYALLNPCKQVSRYRQQRMQAFVVFVDLSVLVGFGAVTRGSTVFTCLSNVHNRFKLHSMNDAVS